MDGEAGWWTTSGNIGLPPLARGMGVGRQQHLSMVADGKIQEAHLAWDLVVEGETNECVKSFYYPGDTIAGADLAATARIRTGWMRFRHF